MPKPLFQAEAGAIEGDIVNFANGRRVEIGIFRNCIAGNTIPPQSEVIAIKRLALIVQILVIFAQVSARQSQLALTRAIARGFGRIRRPRIPFAMHLRTAFDTIYLPHRQGGPIVAQLTAHAEFLLLALLQVVGIATLIAARIGETSRYQPHLQAIFFAMLCGIGASTLVAAVLGSSYWPMCGMTLAIMAVGVTFDGAPAQANSRPVI